jgi:hypothetical protein
VDELIISGYYKDNFVYDWQEDIEKEDNKSKESNNNSEDSDSFDPMAARIVDYQTKVYGEIKKIANSKDCKNNQHNQYIDSNVNPDCSQYLEVKGSRY